MCAGCSWSAVFLDGPLVQTKPKQCFAGQQASSNQGSEQKPSFGWLWPKRKPPKKKSEQPCKLPTLPTPQASHFSDLHQTFLGDCFLPLQRRGRALPSFAFGGAATRRGQMALLRHGGCSAVVFLRVFYGGRQKNGIGKWKGFIWCNMYIDIVYCMKIRESVLFMVEWDLAACLRHVCGQRKMTKMLNYTLYVLKMGNSIFAFKHSDSLLANRGHLIPCTQAAHHLLSSETSFGVDKLGRPIHLQKLGFAHMLRSVVFFAAYVLLRKINVGEFV